jgi:hypothetical protein
MSDMAHHHNWKGGRRTDARGYVHVRVGGRYVREHVTVVEAVLGHPLPRRAVVHHVNGDAAVNHNDNLVVCEDQAYHNLLHARERARAACGNPNWKKCCRCKRYDAPDNLKGFTVRGCPSNQFYHAGCQLQYTRAHPRRDRRRATA